MLYLTACPMLYRVLTYHKIAEGPAFFLLLLVDVDLISVAAEEIGNHCTH